MSLTVSVITAVYDGVATIGDCIRSVRVQDFPVEHVIVDGGSRDGTLPMIKELRHKCLRVMSEPDRGIYDAMNKGLRLASGEVLGILNADDVYADPNVLDRVVEAMADPSVDACYGDLVYVDSADITSVRRYWHAGYGNAERFWWGWMPPHPTFFVRRRAYENYGLFNLSLGSAADYELMLRFLVKYRIRAVYIPDVLVRMRTGGMSNRSLTNRLKANRMDRMAWKANGLKPYPWTLWIKPLRKLPQFWKRPKGQK